MTVDPTYVEVDHAWMESSNRNPFEVLCEGQTRLGNMYFSAPYITLLDGAGEGYHELYHGGCDGALVLPREIKNVLSLSL
jgi:hypothetical protein